MSLAGCAGLADRPEGVFVRVVDTQQVADSSWKTGALIGSAVGLASSIGRGAESTAIRTAGGATIGAGAEKIMTRNNTSKRVFAIDANKTIFEIKEQGSFAPGQCLLMSTTSFGKNKVTEAHTSNCSHIGS